MKGFTLIVLLIFLAIIGILAAIFFSNELTTTQLYTLSLHDALPISIATAWEARATDVNRYNAAGVTLPTVSVSAATDRKCTRLKSSHTLPQYAGCCND